MNAGLFLLLYTTVPISGECKDLKKDMIALELFLQDQEDHAKYCPKLAWKQPDIEVYKKELESQLPEGCVK
ncbi:hypothetical protein CMI47_11740 [Candidatus Pacearchaeota archaeon]|nr:hypothetical protein [Candidatus Pacearchaeota archaeon]|tara:strand:- start:7216 stop:7428 length:213 start_codon:yes stop_codon:yes gene_type:complete